MVRFTENIEIQPELDPCLMFEYPAVKVRRRPWVSVTDRIGLPGSPNKSSMRALIAVIDTESDSMVMEWTRVSSESSVSDGNLMNSLNGPGGGDAVVANLQASRFFGRTIDAIRHLIHQKRKQPVSSGWTRRV